jgi:hypothetical protein
VQPNDSTWQNELLEEIRELYLSGDNAEETVADFEQRTAKGLAELGRRLLKRKLQALSPQAAFVENGTEWSVAVRSAREVITLFGKVSVERPLFRCGREGKTRCLVTERATLFARLWTPRAAKLAAMAVAEMPLAAAEEFLCEAGVVFASRSSLLRLGGALSSLWESDREANEQALREQTPIPDGAVTAAVSLDGVMVTMVDSDRAPKKAEARAEGRPDKGPSGFREASVGVVAFYDADGERLATQRYARMPEEDKRTTKAWLASEIKHIRNARSGMTTVAIADGAANNWTFLAGLGADHEIVDFFHTAEHLHRHVNQANGASTTETQALLKGMRHQLLNEPGAADKIFRDLQELREGAGTASPSSLKTSGKRQPTYFERHRHRMDYVGARSLKLPIGSGVTESTCKLAVCDRLRRTGMRWSSPGGQAVLTLRALKVSGQFQYGWRLLEGRNAERLAA